jgi:hypothetical protein
MKVPSVGHGTVLAEEMSRPFDAAAYGVTAERQMKRPQRGGSCEGAFLPAPAFIFVPIRA